ncbi:hypothetical protein [Myxococcus hansupus]|uniref:hypothetical protein n=1 Tax=Pseudomyxococcus hansupus TaxID=1297742 RepID=UPI0011877060|nr:hypothetical protein [Myxococcus hansupus]
MSTLVAPARVDAFDVAEGEVRLLPGGLQVSNGVLNRGILVVAGGVEVGGEFGDGGVGNAAVVVGSLRCRIANAQGVLRVSEVLEAAQLAFANNAGVRRQGVQVLEGAHRVGQEQVLAGEALLEPGCGGDGRPHVERLAVHVAGHLRWDAVVHFAVDSLTPSRRGTAGGHERQCHGPGAPIHEAR